jgi:glycosyltransferase involved in cell wall biosynthesis
MNISYVNNAYHLGGAETVVRQLHFGMLRAGHESRFYVAEGRTIPHQPGVVPLYPRLLLRLEHSRFHAQIRRWFPHYEWTDKAFRKIANDPADVVHIHSFHGLYATMESLLYLAARKPMLWTFHRFWGITGGCDYPGECRKYFESCGNCPRVDEWPMCGKDNTAQQLQKKRDLLANAPLHIISPSKHLARTVAESPIGKNWKISVIPNGVNPDEFSFKRKHDDAFRQGLGLRPDATIVLVVNRNFKDPVKGFVPLRDALLMTDPKNAQFVFAGGNSDWAVAQLPGHFSCVDMGFITSRSRIADLYEASDIFLYSSPGENFPCAILEAMSAESCIVSTPTDGVIEQIEHGKSGLIASSFLPADLAQTLTDALANPDKVRGYGQAARARVNRLFTEAGMIDAHLALYRSLLQ